MITHFDINGVIKLEFQTLRRRAIMSAFWKFAERILSQLISFIVSIILARLLSPDDYSLVGIVLIFFAFSNILISGGLNTALIQKKNADGEDYFSVLVISVVISVVVYGILWFCSPLIAQLYNKEELTVMLRVMGIVLPINAIKLCGVPIYLPILHSESFFYRQSEVQFYLH